MGLVRPAWDLRGSAPFLMAFALLCWSNAVAGGWRSLLLSCEGDTAVFMCSRGPLHRVPAALRCVPEATELYIFSRRWGPSSTSCGIPLYWADHVTPVAAIARLV